MVNVMEQDILKVLVSEEELRERVRVLGEQINEKYRDKRPL